MPLVSACAWCQAEGKGPAPARGQTHTICRRHMRQMLEAAGVHIPELSDDVPSDLSTQTKE